jgi:hypothetical protein
MEKRKIKGRIHVTMTPAQKRRMKQVRASIAAELPDLIRRNQLAHDARKEKTFSGHLRRVIHGYPLSPMKIAEKTGISWIDLDDFLTGEKVLPSDVIDRLVKVLGLRFPLRKTRGSKKAS